jgi:hypothetical protein
MIDKTSQDFSNFKLNLHISLVPWFIPTNKVSMHKKHTHTNVTKLIMTVGILLEERAGEKKYDVKCKRIIYFFY